MKRFCMLLVLLTLMLCGCDQSEPATVATISPGPVSITVSSVDELLAAIDHDTEIILEPGFYDLTAAADYGVQTQKPYYSWVSVGDGFQLTVAGVDNCTIRGSGGEATKIVHTNRYANVLVFQNCTNLVLEGFTAGHTDGGECAGGVILLQNCETPELNNLGLYGCGITGVLADHCTDVTIRSSEIYDCSYTAVEASDTDGLRVEDCTIHDLGGDQFAAGEVFWFHNCTDVNIRRCNVSDNRVRNLLNCQPAAGIELRETAFVRNRVHASVFEFSGGGLVMDSCSFEDNEIRQWFSGEDATVLDGIGKSWTEEMLAVWYNPPVETLPSAERQEVTASTVDELIAAIAPNTEIVLKDGTYDLSKAKDYGKSWSDWYYWSEEFDGPSLVISGVENLVIRSESGDSRKCTISAVPRYANVLSFKSCNGITVSGITAGHTVEPGYCMGGVLYFEDSDNLLVNRCRLYGCGTLGVQASLCSAIAVTGCEIYECSYGGIQIGNTSGIKIENCSFRDLGGDAISFYACKDVTVDGQQVSGNSRLSY